MIEHELLHAKIREALRQTAIHYGLWFSESQHRFGLETALDAEQEAGDLFMAIRERKVSKVLGHSGLGEILTGQDLNQDQERLASLHEALCASWLAADGVWFQAVEKRQGMVEAKAVNDACWASFAPLEARRVKALLSLPETGGLDVLKQVLSHRMYATLNVWEIVEETEDSFVFRMRECRVQTARKRKGLEDYPCKSGGTVEYQGLAKGTDPRIIVECIGCPPDAHPEQWYCAWRFSLPKG
jgi:hypothetical protein